MTMFDSDARGRRGKDRMDGCGFLICTSREEYMHPVRSIMVTEAPLLYLHHP